MIHLTIQQLSSYLDGELTGMSATITRQHLSSCESCASRYAKLEALGVGLSEALKSDPDEAAFERLAGEIEQRIQTERQVRVERPAPIEEPFPAARRTRVEPPSAPLPSRVVETRAPRRRSAPSIPWAAVLVIGTIVAGAGAMILVARNVSSWLGASGSISTTALDPGQNSGPTEVAASPVEAAGAEDPGVDSAAFAAATPVRPAQASSPEAVPAPAPPPAGPPKRPARDTRSYSSDPRVLLVEELGDDISVPAAPQASAVPSSPADAGADAAEAPPESADAVFSVLDAEARALVLAAHQRSSDAARSPSAPRYEAAAAEWERTLPLLRGGAHQAARYHLAEARYRAWEIGLGSERAERAGAALRAYLVVAPAGPERETAIQRLLHLEDAGFR